MSPSVQVQCSDLLRLTHWHSNGRGEIPIKQWVTMSRFDPYTTHQFTLKLGAQGALPPLARRLCTRIY